MVHSAPLRKTFTSTSELTVLSTSFERTVALAQRARGSPSLPSSFLLPPPPHLPIGPSSQTPATPLTVTARYEVGVCVCAGIGVTPFASLLRELQHKQFSGAAASMKTKHVYFYWICPGFDSWGWFSNLLVDFEHECHEKGIPDFLNIRIHMSRGWTKDDAETLYMQAENDGETLVKDDQGRTLKSKMNFGG